MKDRRPRLHPFVRFKQRFDRAIIVLPETAFLLGGSGEAILRLCDGQRSEAEIVETLSETESQSERDRIQGEIERFLSQMESLGVLETTPKSETEGVR